MNLHKSMYLAVFIVSSFFIGCATSPVPYSLMENDLNSSSIAFRTGNPGVTFISFNGLTPPKPERGTHWDPISFPSGTDLRIIVHAEYQTSSKTTLSGFGLLGAVVNVAQDVRAVSRNVDVELVFNCPPLQAGREYVLTFTKEPGMPGKNILTLTEAGTTRIVHQQEFEVNFGGDDIRQ